MTPTNIPIAIIFSTTVWKNIPVNSRVRKERVAMTAAQITVGAYFWKGCRFDVCMTYTTSRTDMRRKWVMKRTR